MVSEDAQTPFSVIGPQKDLPNGLRIYKLFSKQHLANATVAAIVANLTVLSSRQVVQEMLFVIRQSGCVGVCRGKGMLSGFAAGVKILTSKWKFCSVRERRFLEHGNAQSETFGVMQTCFHMIMVRSCTCAC